MKNHKEIIFKLISIGFGFGLALLMLEIFARLLPARRSLALVKPIICKEKEIDINCFHHRKSGKTIKFTAGKLPPFKLNATKITNDIGQFSDTDFKDFINLNNNEIGLIAIGDSYIEAIQVNNKESFHGLLNNKLITFKNNKKKRLISTSLGSSGMALPNYLKSIEFFSQKKDISNDFIVIGIISNDFDESFRKFSPTWRRGGKGQFFFNENGSYEFIPFPKDKGGQILITFLMENSALINYLTYNLHMVESIISSPVYCLIDPDTPNCNKEIKYSSNVIEEDFKSNEKRYKISYKASEIFVDKLTKLRPSLTEREKTILVIDADRRSIYGKSSKGIFFDSQRIFLMNLLNKNGFNVVDMENIFRKDYLLNKKVFNHDIDMHWNKHGHKVVANAIKSVLQNIKLE